MKAEDMFGLSQCPRCALIDKPIFAAAASLAWETLW